MHLSRQLIVYKAPEAHCWMVKAINVPEVHQAFCSEDIASPFTPQAKAEGVQREIQRLNPGCPVNVLEERLYVWCICEFVARNPETCEAAALRDFVLSLCFPADSVNLEILFRVITAQHKALVLQALDLYATVGKTQEVLVCGQWMNVLEEHVELRGLASWAARRVTCCPPIPATKTSFAPPAFQAAFLPAPFAGALFVFCGWI